MAMATAGLYRRVLPSPPAMEFSSPEGKRIFAEALGLGTMEGFFKLISYYQTQSEPAYCGLATLATVLNALAIDPGRKWKGPWRWFDDSMLDCCEPLDKIKVEGITFGKVACLAQCNGAKVKAFRANQSTIDDFRKHVISCSSSEDCHLIVSYHRGTFNQTGTGHFSPVGGYHAVRDMVLILDVARFKYPPHWVPLTLLWEAMGNIDEATGHPRGYMIISRVDGASSILYTLSCRHEGWNSVAKYLTENVPLLLKSEDVKDIQSVLSVVFKSPPAELSGFVTWVAEVRRQEDGNFTLSEEEKGRLVIKEEILRQVRATALFNHVTRWLDSEISCCNSIVNCGDKDLPSLAASVCCQGAYLLTCRVKLGLSDGTCCPQVNIKTLNADGEADGENPVTLVSGTVKTGDREPEVEVLVPLCQRDPSRLCFSSQNHCIVMHPSTADVLTVLLLALPPLTWSGIKEENLREEVNSLVKTENLPPLLQEEALFMRQQLNFLMTDVVSASPM